MFKLKNRNWIGIASALLYFFALLAAPQELEASKEIMVSNGSGGGIKFTVMETTDPPDTNSDWNMSQAQEDALKRAAAYWIELLMPGVDRTVNLTVTNLNTPVGSSTLAFAGPYYSPDEYFQYPMSIINNTNPPYMLNNDHGSITIFNFNDIYELQSNNAHGASLESVLIHELAHVFGINGVDLPYNSFYSYQEKDMNGKWFFNGPISKLVYNDGDTSGTALMPLDNDQLDYVPPDEEGARAHIGVFGSVMGYGVFRNYPMLIEVELAALNDIGYSFDRKNFFGTSIYTDGVNETSLTPFNNNQGFSARNSTGTAYVAGESNLSTYGIGLHVFGNYHDITQNADILADGTAAAGVRIDGTVNHLTINPGVKVTANGARGAAVLVAFGSDHVINHMGSIEATGENGVGLRFDFGMSGGSSGVNSGLAGAFQNAFSYYGSGWSGFKGQMELAKNLLLKGAAANKVNITGTITAGTLSPRSAAIYMGPGAHVVEINFMRPYGGSVTNPITGHIISDYDINSNPYESLKTTVLNFGYESSSDGDVTTSVDSSFDLILNGKILGYDATWAGPSTPFDDVVYQYSEADTFIGRGLLDLNFVGGLTTVNNDIWVNKLVIGSSGSLKVKDGSSFIVRADSNRLQNNGKIIFDVANSLDFGNIIYGSGGLEKIGAGSLNISSAQNFAGMSTVNNGTLFLTSTGSLSTVTVNTLGVLSGIGTVGSLIVNGGGLSPAGAETIGTLKVTNSLTLDNSTIYVDLSANPQSDLISYTGTTALGLNQQNPNKVSLSSLLNGAYLLVSLTNSTVADIEDYFTNVYFNGSPLDNSQFQFYLNGSNSEIWLTLSDPGTDLTWDGTSGENWSSTNAWKLSNSSQASFSDYDYVIFDNTAQNQNVELTSAAAAVSGMKITGGNYTFSGYGINGQLRPLVSHSNTGKLEITGGTATFKNTITFQEGLDISSGAKLVLADQGMFGGSMAITNEGTLELDRTTDFTLAAASNTMSGSGSLVKKGSLKLTISGDYSGATGTLDHQGGEVALAGTYGGSYTQSTGAVLNPTSASVIKGCATFHGKVITGSALGILGNATFDGATINLNPDSYQLIAVNGSTQFTGTVNKIDLLGFKTGEYVILTSTGGLTFLPSNIGVTKGGTALAGRESYSWDSASTNNLKLTLFNQNLELIWNTVNGNWNTADTNKVWKNGSDSYAFMAGDKVLFQDKGTEATINVVGATVVSDMEVQSGEFIFTGDSIRGSNTGTPLASPGGKLTIFNGGKGTFQNSLDFGGGIAINSGGTFVLGNGGSFATNMDIYNLGFLEINRTDDFTLAKAENSLSGSGSLVKKGVSKLTLSGDYSGATGTLDHQAGEVVLAGTYGGHYTQAAGAVLSTTFASTIIGNASFNGTVITNYALSIGGAAIFEGTTINRNLGSGEAINVTGNVALNGTSNTINIYTYTPGSYTIITSSGTLTSVNSNLTVKKGGQDLTGREGYSWDNSTANALILTLDSQNIELVWNPGGGTWDGSGSNWSEGANSYAFMNGDKVVFQNSGTENITVSGTATVSDMEIRSGEFVFSGDTIIGSISGTSFASPGGKLTVKNGGKGIFQNALDFYGGLDINSGGTFVLSDGGSLSTMAINNLGIMEINRAADFTLASSVNSLSGNGSLVKKGTGKLTITGNYSGANGNLDHQAGELELTGTYGGNYTQAVLAKLTPGVGATINGNGIFQGTIATGAALGIYGNATFVGATINFNPDSYQLITVGGTALFDGTTNKIDLASFKNGIYVILSATGALTFSNSGPVVTKNGMALAGRENYSWDSPSTKDLKLTLFSNNLELVWNMIGGTWNKVDTNVVWKNGSDNYAFMGGDKVVFQNSASGNVTVSEAVNVSDMDIQSGDYVFSGNSIIGSVSGTSIAAPGGKLTIFNSGTGTFQNTLDFAGGLFINLGGKFVLGEGGSISTMAINNLGTLEFNRTADFTLASSVNSLSGNGSLVKKGTGKLTLSGDYSGATGNLDHQKGEVALAGTYGGSYTQVAGTVLNPTAASTITGNAIFRGSVATDYTLNIGGEAKFQGATINRSTGIGQTIIANGNVEFTGFTNTINMSAYSYGDYTIITSAGGTVSYLPGELMVTKGGQALEGREGYSLSKSTSSSLVLSLISQNLELVWNSGSSTWNYLGSNWSEGVNSHIFMDGDKVVFQNSGTENITVAEAVTVSDMEIQSGENIFSGSSITGSASDSATSLANPGGKLKIMNGAKAVFDNIIEFAGGLAIEFGGTFVLTGNGGLGGTDITNVGSLEIDRTADFTLADNGNSLTGSGSLVKKGTGKLTIDGNYSSATGNLDHQAGEVYLNGVYGGSYTQSVGTLLTAVTGSGLKGAEFSGTIASEGTLAITGAATFKNGAEIKYNLASLAPAVSVSGATTFAGTTTINLSNFLPDTYILITTGAGFSFQPGSVLQVLVNNSALGTRQTADFDYSDNSNLKMELTNNNVVLTWKNVQGNYGWGDSNWKNPADVTETQIAGDKVIFAGDGQGTVNLASQANVSDMEITSGSYVFTGQSIIGSSNGSTIAGALGKLTVMGLVTTIFENALNFTTMEVANTAQVTFKDGGGFTGALVNDGSVIFNPGTSFSQTLSKVLTSVSGNGTIEKTGAGTLAIIGDYSQTTQDFTHSVGNVNLSGTWGGDYLLSVGAVLATADQSEIIGDATLSGTVNVSGSLKFGGNATFSGATINLTPTTGLVNVVSSAIFGSGTAVTFNIPTFTNGEALLVRAGSIQDLNSPDTQLIVTVNGLSLTPRQGNQFKTEGSDLYVSLYSQNLSMNWTAGVDRFWDLSTSNWSGSGQTTFLGGDRVIFDTSGQGQVNVVDPVRVAELIVNGGSYEFVGAAITGSVDDTNYAGATGKLTVTGGAALTIKNQVGFSLGLEIDSGSTLTLADSGSISEGAVSNLGQLIFNQSSDSQAGFTVSGPTTASVVKKGTNALTVGNNTLSAFYGSFSQESGKVTINGVLGGDYTQQVASTELAAGEGASILGSLVLAGTLSGSSLNVDGNVTANASKLNLDFQTLGSSPLITAGGTITFSGVNAININTFTTGAFTVAQGVTGLSASLSNFSAVSVGGGQLGERQFADLSLVGNTLVVTLVSGDNVILEWTNGVLNGKWNAGDANFTDGNVAPEITKFAHNDYVKFGAAGAGTVEVSSGNVTVSGMEVTAGSYVFDGYDIVGVNDAVGSRFTTTGELIIRSGAEAEFKNRTTFINGLTIESGAVAVLGEGGNFGGMAVQNQGTFEIDRGSDDYLLSGNLSGSGTWVKKGSGRLTVSGTHSTVTGVLDHQVGSISLDGLWGGSYQSSSGTSLVAESGAQVTGTAAFRGTVSLDGLLAIGSQATFDGATLMVDMANSDRVEANSFAFGSQSTLTVELASLTAGEYAFLESVGAVFNTSNLADWNLTPLNHSRASGSLALSADQTKMLLQTTVTNLELTWQGFVDSVWDMTTANWSGNEKFLTGDQVVFTGSAQGQVGLADNITLGKMTVSSGDYEFIGLGGLQGVANTGLSSSDGSLSVMGGSMRLATYSGAEFEGGISVGGGRLILASNLTTPGDFVLTTTGTLVFEGYLDNNTLLTPILTAQNIVLGGTLAAEMANIQAASSNTQYSSVVASAAGSLDLQPMATSTGAKPFFEYSFDQSGTDLVLTVTPKLGDTGLVSLGGGNRNNSSLLGSIQHGIQNGVVIGGELEQVLIMALNASSVAEAQAVVANLNGVLVPHRLVQSRELSLVSRTFVAETLGYEPVKSYAVAAGSPDSYWSVNTSVTGRWGRRSATHGDPGYKLKNSSAQLAVDHRSGPWRLGAAFMIGKTDTDWDNMAEADSNDYSGVLFGRLDFDPWFYMAQVFMGGSRVESSRYPAPGLKASGTFNVNWFGGSLSVGRRFDVADWDITPRFGATYTTTRLGAFSETGAGNLSLSYSATRVNSLEADAGVFLSRNFVLESGRVFTPRLNLGLAYETMDSQVSVATSFAQIPGIPAFVSIAPDFGRLRVITELGAGLTVTDNMSIGLDYRGSFRSKEQIHSGTLSFNINY
jgi:autotransporter-associated beta strand protein